MKEPLMRGLFFIWIAKKSCGLLFSTNKVLAILTLSINLLFDKLLDQNLNKLPDENEQVNNKPELKDFRKALRNNSTPAEVTLWKALKGKQLGGRKFRRQFSVENYILDFYCPSEKLAIELDGHGHFTEAGLAYDAERTSFLNSRGITVIRFENVEVLKALDNLLENIKANFTTPKPS
jgi:very-short-patch-repair endonuclease